MRTWNTTKGPQDPDRGGRQPTTPADPRAAAPALPGSGPRRLRWRRPLLALVALAAIGVLAVGCGSNGSGSSSGSGSGGTGGYGSSGTAPASGGASSAATVSATSTNLGMILVDGSGRTLYLFGKDQPNHSACTGACAAAWPVDQTSGTPKAGSGVTASLLGTIKRGDGSTQATYNKHPLYYYSGDSQAGQQNGQGINAFGATWHVLTPAGTAVSGGATAATSANGGGYGYGG